MGHYFLISEMDALRLAGNSQEAGLAGYLTNLLMSALASEGACSEVGRALLPTTALLKILSVEHRSKGLKILGSRTVPPSSAWVVLSSLVPELWGQIPISSSPTSECPVRAQCPNSGVPGGLVVRTQLPGPKRVGKEDAAVGCG